MWKDVGRTPRLKVPQLEFSHVRGGMVVVFTGFLEDTRVAIIHEPVGVLSSMAKTSSPRENEPGRLQGWQAFAYKWHICLLADDSVAYCLHITTLTSLRFVYHIF